MKAKIRFDKGYKRYVKYGGVSSSHWTFLFSDRNVNKDTAFLPPPTVKNKNRAWSDLLGLIENAKK